jgi:hypothetical protein
MSNGLAESGLGEQDRDLGMARRLLGGELFPFSGIDVGLAQDAAECPYRDLGFPGHNCGVDSVGRT